jgi:hypothetical protein
LASDAIAPRIRVDGPVPASNHRYSRRAKPATGDLATLATGRRVLNIGKISDSRFKFSFATEEGTLFCEISVPMKTGVAVSDDLRQRAAVAKLKRLLEAMDTAMKDLDLIALEAALFRLRLQPDLDKPAQFRLETSRRTRESWRFGTSAISGLVATACFALA